ncbi:hypothetical protein ACIBJI_24530 [Nocardia sp. NPDC050408]|uniref:hypothetical protein n=1 Tax=Nocardia sp. NPDC050408 TaxID=3364319 RepID=UPI0037B9EA2E
MNYCVWTVRSQLKRERDQWSGDQTADEAPVCNRDQRHRSCCCQGSDTTTPEGAVLRRQRPPVQRGREQTGIVEVGEMQGGSASAGVTRELMPLPKFQQFGTASGTADHHRRPLRLERVCGS